MKNTEPEDYYVYCYIDPRNFEEFYYGKGKGNRSQSLLLEQGESDKAARVKQIKAAGVEPTIRIIARDLTEDQALLVETALIWKLGKWLTNKIAGQYARKFRPQNTLHKKLPGFDFSHGIYFFNVGEGKDRNWDDCRTYGFLSEGHGAKFAKQARKLHAGDIVAAYLSGFGYVGIGRVISEAVPVRDFRIGNKFLEKMKNQLKAPKVLHNSDDDEQCEWVIRIKWLIKKTREGALRKPGIFATPAVLASLANQPKTCRYIEEEWGVKFEKLLAQDKS